jgi:hypothetical protein
MNDYDDYDDYGDWQGHPNYPQQHPVQNNKRMYAETAGNTLQALTDYAKTLEKEKSNRADIERKRNTALSFIRSQRHVMIEYLAHRFGERGKLYERYFQLVDTALELQNDEIIRIALDSILNVYQDNPGAGIEDFRQRMESISEVVRI